VDEVHGQDPGQAPVLVHDGPVLRLALQEVRQRVAQDVVAVDDRHGRGAPAGIDPGDRAPRVVELEPVGDLLLGPEVDVAHAQEREALQGAVGADEVADEVVGGLHEQLRGRRVLLQPPAALEHRDPVAHLDRLVDVVRDEDDRPAHPLLQPQELVLQALAGDGVDRAERLVHEHHGRVAGQGAGDADALALAAGELRGVPGRELLLQPGEHQQLADALVAAPAVPPQQLGDRGDVLRDRAVREQPDLLDDVADLAAQGGRVALGDRAAAEQDVPVGDVDHPVDHPHRGGLAAPGRADEDADLAGRHLERQGIDRGLGRAGVALGRRTELEGLRGGR
jgi:hypothetical protein